MKAGRFLRSLPKAKVCLLSSILWENPCHYCFPQMLTFTEKTMRQEKGEWTNCPTIKKVVFGTQGITKNWIHCTLPMYVEKLGLSWFFVNCYALFNRVVSLWHSSSRTCVISRGKVSLLDRYQTQISLAVAGLWGSGKVSLSASKNF